MSAIRRLRYKYSNLFLIEQETIRFVALKFDAAHALMERLAEERGLDKRKSF